jgi:hypothetical protein
VDGFFQFLSGKQKMAGESDPTSEHVTQNRRTFVQQSRVAKEGICINKTPVQYRRFQTISSCKPSIYPALILSVSAESMNTKDMLLQAQEGRGWERRRRKRLPRP